MVSSLEGLDDWKITLGDMTRRALGGDRAEVEVWVEAEEKDALEKL